MKSPIKWAGGKRRLLPVLQQHVPGEFGTYHEPFLGGGALLLNLQPSRACVGDLNADLINLYREIKRNPQEVFDMASSYPNTKEFFYRVRAQEPTDPLERAARFLYLNRTCFNGLYRVNSKGKFNVPFANYKKISFDLENLMAVSSYLRNNEVSLEVQGYQQALINSVEGDFVYMDPPYFGTFTGYTPGQFDGEAHLLEMADCVQEAVSRGAKVLMSNSNNPRVLETFREYTIIPIEMAWTIGQKGSTRARKENEVLIKTYQ